MCHHLNAMQPQPKNEKTADTEYPMVLYDWFEVREEYPSTLFTPKKGEKRKLNTFALGNSLQSGREDGATRIRVLINRENKRKFEELGFSGPMGREEPLMPTEKPTIEIDDKLVSDLCASLKTIDVHETSGLIHSIQGKRLHEAQNEILTWAHEIIDLCKKNGLTSSKIDVIQKNMQRMTHLKDSVLTENRIPSEEYNHIKIGSKIYKKIFSLFIESINRTVAQLIESPGDETELTEINLFLSKRFRIL